MAGDEAQQGGSAVRARWRLVRLRQLQHPRLGLALILVCGLAASLALFVAFRRADERARWSRFERAAAERVSALRLAMERVTYDLEALSALFESSRPVDRLEFQRYASHIWGRYRRDSQAIEWAPRVAHRDRAAFEAEVRREGLPGFSVTERRGDQAAPASPREEYFPITYVEPLEGNEAALGFDLGSSAVRRAALEAARSSGRKAATARVRLVQEPGAQLSVLVVLPVFPPPAPGRDVAPDGLGGYVLASYRVGVLLQNAFGPLRGDEADVHVYDASASGGERPLASFDGRAGQVVGDPPDEAEALRGPHLEDTIDVAGRSWRVICTPVAGSAVATARGYPWVILAGALLVTLLVAGYLLVLAASEARTRAVIESASDGIVLVGPDGRVERLNAAAERLFGWTGAEAVGHPFLEALVAPASRADARALLQALETAGAARADRELRGQRRDGSEFPMSCSAGAAHAAGAALTALFVRDLTEAQQRELELRQAQKLEAVGRLAAGIAHEINTPIQFIGDNTRFLEEAFRGYDRMLEAQHSLLPAGAEGPLARVAAEVELDELRAEVPRTLERTIQGVRRVATIVRAMKEFAHPDQKQMVATDLNRGIQATLEVARNEYKYVAVLVTELGPLPPVVCHAGDLNQVVLNLVVNASHAVADVHERTGERGTIRVSTAREGDHAVIRVADSGPGIPAPIRDRIFDPFFTTKEVGRGSGQGLAIARTIVAAHRGTIGFETAEGAGTTFTVRIPLDGGASGGIPQGTAAGA